MKFSQFIEDSGLSFNSPITQEEWDRITDVELENTEIITFKTPSGKEVSFQKIKHGEWINPEMGYEDCSVCGYCFAVYDEHEHQIERNFCPNCGADMRKRRDTECINV